VASDSTMCPPPPRTKQAASNARSFLSSDGIALFDGPSPRRSAAEPLRGTARCFRPASSCCS
jgi:hypothetical protein